MSFETIPDSLPLIYRLLTSPSHDTHIRKHWSSHKNFSVFQNLSKKLSSVRRISPSECQLARQDTCTAALQSILIIMHNIRSVLDHTSFLHVPQPASYDHTNNLINTANKQRNAIKTRVYYFIQAIWVFNIMHACLIFITMILVLWYGGSGKRLHAQSLCTLR